MALLIFMQLEIDGKESKAAFLDGLDQAMIDPAHNATIAQDMARVIVTTG